LLLDCAARAVRPGGLCGVSPVHTELPDVLVAGLGPAGSSAAAAAARAGLDVIAIDRRKRGGAPVQCGEFVPRMIEREVPSFGPATVQPIGRMRTFVEQEPAEEASDFRGWMVEREIFDQMLIREAARAGATCWLGTSLRQIERDGTLLLSDGSACRPRVLIGADGPRSQVGKAIGQTNRELAETRQVTVPLTFPHDATDVFLRADYRGGYGWLFPKGAVANLGIGVAAEERQSLKRLLTGLHAELAGSRRVGTHVIGTTGGAIPVGGRVEPVGRLGAAAVLLAGDAAGLANPVTGAGIAAALHSGRLAGRGAAEWLGGCAGAIDAYAEELGDLFDLALSRARRRRREVLGCYADGGRPGAKALRDGWIMSQQYWAA
jgi:digeranylgeranylglycerophospholipid reductase